MLVTTAMIGDRRRKVPSLSSASATRNSPWPRRALVPSVRSLPPTTTVGSRNVVAERQQHLGDATHADTADADEMNPPLPPAHHASSVARSPGPRAPLQAHHERCTYRSLALSSSGTAIILAHEAQALRRHL